MSYFDESTEAHLQGHAQGRIQGEQAGRRAGFQVGQQDGYDLGYTDGRADGYTAGWNGGIARGNEEIQKQMGFTRKHVEEKEALKLQLEEQRLQIQQLMEKLSVAEAENVELKRSNQEMRNVVGAIQQVNEELRNEVAQLTEENIQREWKLNSCIVFMSSLRNVLEDLTLEDGPQADLVRITFAKRYMENIQSAIERGAIKAPLHTDPDLGMPKTRQFIENMLLLEPAVEPDVDLT